MASSPMALSPLGAARKLNQLHEKLSKSSYRMTDDVTRTYHGNHGHGRDSRESSSAGGVRMDRGGHGSYKTGLEASLAATATLMEACHEASGAVDALKNESGSLIEGIEAQVSLARRDFEARWTQHESEIASIAEDLATTLSDALRTIRERDIEVAHLRKELEDQRLREVACVRRAMEVSGEKDAENKRLRAKLESVRMETASQQQRTEVRVWDSPRTRA